MSALNAISNRIPPLRTILLFDAAACVAMGLGLTLASAVLATLFALPASLLNYAGIALLPIAAFMAWVATRANPPRLGVWMVIVGNAAWVIASIAVLVGGWTAPNLLGQVFVIAQSVAVVVLGVLEHVAMPRAL